MYLEQTLQMYEIRKGEVDKISSHGGLYELLSGGCPGAPGGSGFISGFGSSL